MHSKLRALYSEFYSFVNDYPNNLVFKELKERFHDRILDADEALEDIPHPYRQYVVLGQRMVLETIIEAAKVAPEIKEEDNE